MTCSVAVCDRPPSARGWCAAHYLQWRKTGAVSQSPIRRYARSLNLATCTVEECGATQYARGWCRSHYTRWQRTGSIFPVVRVCQVESCGERCGYSNYCAFHGRRARHGVQLDAPRYAMPTGPCAVDGCEGNADTRRGWCQRHYSRWHRTGDPGTATFRSSEPIAPGTSCQVDGCAREVVARGWCNRHYKRWLAGRDVAAERQPIVADFRRSVPTIQADSLCARDDCRRHARSRGLCQAHYHQQRRIALSRSA